MNYNSRRVLSLLLAVLMILSLLPMTAFAQDDAAATFRVSETVYANLNEAIAAAKDGTDKTIVVASDGTLSGNYTIPTGVTLLVPFDDADTLYTTEPEASESIISQTAYRTLTLTDDASITVKGAISVGGKLYTSSSTHVCKPTGAYGQIKMSDSSQITVEDGGTLYAWGYITGSGNVRITSGATVYECFQVTDWRGGSATIKFVNPSTVKKVFPFSQYYVQNIEAPLTIEYGGAEKAYIVAYGEKITIGFIGTNCMFELAEGCIFTKTYDSATDRISFDISGGASLKGIKMTVVVMTIDSANYVLPINNNVNINIHSGVTAISQNVALLPGVRVTIDNGAELNIKSGANLYVYDADQWNKDYVWGSRSGINQVAYSPSGKGSRAISDASINVNGELTINGSVYTTAGGAEIYSSESTGKFVQTVVPGTEANTYQCTQSGSGFFDTKVTPVEIPITPAKLHNADGSYTETAASKAGDTYVYADGKWAIKANEIAITFNPNGGTGSMDAMSVNPGVDNVLSANTFTREDYTFTGWNTAADGTGTAYADKATVNFDADTILYAQWKRADGWVTDDQGRKQYYKNDEIQKTGLTEIDGETYYLDPETGYAAIGLVRIVKAENDVNYYCFDGEGKAYKATADTNEYAVANNNGYELPEGNNYRFDANGVIEHFDGCPNGIYQDEVSDNYYYCVDGIIIANGLMKIGDSYYYAKTSTGAFVRNESYWVTKTNGLLDEGIYTFDEEGKIVFPTDPEEPEVKNGIVSENESLYYYVNGTLTGAGLILIDGNYYYVKTSTGEVVHGRDYWITATNSLLTAGLYTFDETGKLIMEEPPEPPVETKNGIVSENGSLYYYVDGTLTGAGLILIDGNYYYVKTSTGEVIHGRSYWITATNDLLPAGPYNFADDGKLMQQ